MKKKITNRPAKAAVAVAPPMQAAMPYIAPSPSQPGASDVSQPAQVVVQPMVTPPPAPGQELVRYGSVAAAPVVPGKPGQIVSAANRWRENYNPLRKLTMRRAVELLELGQRGDMAYLQWAYNFCERRNPTLSGLVSRCEAPLMSFDWSIKIITSIPEGMTEDTFKAKAEKQKRDLEDAYNLVDNMREAIMHLHKADFRGYAHLQKHRNADGDVTHLECLAQWCICRDGLNGNWFWNPDSRSTSMPLQFLGVKYCIGSDALPLTDFIIREVDRPIDEIGIVHTVRYGICQKDWDGFIEIYGIPGGVVIMPTGIPVGKESEYEQTASRVAEGASGALPAGSDYKPNVLPRGQDPFTARIDQLDASLVLAGTGGKLTMLTDHSAGTMRGNSRVHDETFGQIASGRAQNISELFQRHFDAEILAKTHPGEPALVYFSFGGEEEIDVTELCTNVATLSTAGKNVNTAWLEEKIGYQFDADAEGNPAIEETQPALQPGQPGQQTRRAAQAGSPANDRIQNRIANGGPGASRFDDISAEIHAALEPVLVRVRKIKSIDDPDSQRAALQKLAKDFPSLAELIALDKKPGALIGKELAEKLLTTEVSNG